MVQSLLKLLWEKLDGWKSIIGFIITSLPLTSTSLPIKEALEEAITNPSAASIAIALAYILLAVGLAHKAAKNVGLASSRNDSAAQQLRMPPHF